MAVNIIFSHPLGCVKHVITLAKARVITVSTHPLGCEKSDINLQYGQQLITSDKLTFHKGEAVNYQGMPIWRMLTDLHTEHSLFFNIQKM